MISITIFSTILVALVALYWTLSFPAKPDSLVKRHSLSSLPPSSTVRSIYPEDYYLGGDYASLPYGKVLDHRPQSWETSDVARKIVLVPGISVPAMTWKYVAPGLAANGYRVLIYDLYGRGYSEAPVLSYTTEFYVTQLALLMQYIQWPKAVLMGLSMGGGIAVAFTANFPRLVEQLVLIGGTGLLKPSEILFRHRIMSFLPLHSLNSLAISFFQSSKVKSRDDEDIFQLVLMQSKLLPGYIPAVMSSIRTGPVRGLRSAFESEALKSRNILILHGSKDYIVPYSHALAVKNLLPHADLVVIEGAKHNLAIENAPAVLDSFFRFMLQCSK